MSYTSNFVVQGFSQRRKVQVTSANWYNLTFTTVSALGPTDDLRFNSKLKFLPASTGARYIFVLVTESEEILIHNRTQS
jgi:hypothetical protein